MQTFNQSLATLYFEQADHAARRRSASARDPDELQDMINRGAGLATPQAAAARGRGRTGR